MMRHWLLYATLIFFAPLVSHGEVQLTGLLANDIDAVYSTYKNLKDRQLKPHEIDEILQFLMKDGSYESIDAVSTEPGKIIFRAVPLKKVVEIKVIGNTRLDDSTVLSAFNIKVGSSFKANQISEGAEKIKELYGREGYFNTSIGFSYIEKDPSNTLIEIAIGEGEPCRITNIQFESTNKELIKRLQKEAKGYRNKVFTEGIIIQIERELSEFLRESRHLNAKLEQKNATYNPEKTKASLVYKVLDVYRYEVIFTGNKSYTSADLFRALDLDNFDSGSVDPSSDITKVILNKYITHGFAFAKVTIEEKIDELNYLRRLNVVINEGAKVKITKYDITGRLSRAPAYYSRFLKKNSSDAIDDNLFVKTDLENGFKNLLASLNNEGFLRARIQSVRYEFAKSNSEVKIKLVLDEGPLTQLRAINFEGNTSFTNDQLLKVVDLKPNEPLELKELEQAIRNLTTYYQNHGFIEMRLENQNDEFIQYDDKGAQANILFKIFEGPFVRVQSILIEGNSFTKDSVILRQLEIKKGDTLTLYKLDEARKRVERMGIFARVELRTLEANSKVSDRTLIVSITEQDPGLFRIGFGVNNNRELTLRGFTGASYNNINGTARAISGRINVENNIVKTKYSEYEASVSYLEPFIIDSNFRGRVNFTRQEKVVDFSDGYRTLKIEQSDKLGFIAERDITSHVRFAWNAWTFETVRNFYHGHPTATQVNTEQKIATIGPVLDFEYRDNPLLPTRGTFTRIEADYSDPKIGSSTKVNFLRTQGTFSHYLRLFSPNWIWANSVRGGYGKNISDKDGSGIPESYAFFLGGFSSLRGYSGTPNDRVPNKAYFNTGEGNQLVIPKETSYHLVKSEVRFPLYGILGGVLFTDIGNVKVNRTVANNGYNRSDRQTYGIGIRVNTPVGPLSIDYARKTHVDKCIALDSNGDCESESPDQLHVSIGTF